MQTKNIVESNLAFRKAKLSNVIGSFGKGVNFLDSL